MKNSIMDYEGFLENTRLFFNKYGLENSNRFIEYIRTVYKNKKRVFLDKKFMWLLYDDYLLVKNSGIRWYAVVGSGGTGKTTLSKNIGYFFDNTFNTNRICFDTDELVDNLLAFPEVDAMKSVCLDEPDQDVYPTSIKGRKLRDILGKARNQKIFCLFCATDMYDIPDYIYKKITGIFFCNKKGTAIYYRDQPNNNIFIISKLKTMYKQHGYKCFYLPEFKRYAIYGSTHKMTPLSSVEEKKYNKKKVTDYVKTLNEFKPKQINPNKKTNRNEQIVKLRNKGIEYKKIAERFSISENNARKIYHSYSKKG